MVIYLSFIFIGKSQDVFLLLDEVPCNSDSGSFNSCFGKPSGNWTGLRSNGVNLMIALKPIDDGNIGPFAKIWARLRDGQEMGVNLRFPEEIEHLELFRIYRCTQRISRFYEEIVKKRQDFTEFDSNYDGPQINKSSNSYIPGHEILGEPPEVLLLPRCACIHDCSNPKEHLLVANKSKIFALLKRIQTKVNAADEKITVIIDTTTTPPLHRDLVKISTS